MSYTACEYLKYSELVNSQAADCGLPEAGRKKGNHLVGVGFYPDDGNVRELHGNGSCTSVSAKHAATAK